MMLKNDSYMGDCRNCLKASSIYKIIFLLMLLPLVGGCNSSDKSSSGSKSDSDLVSPEANEEHYQEIGAAIGLNFRHSIGADEMKNIVESVGGGAAFLDYDQDGFLDVYVTSGTWIKGFSKNDKPKELPENHLYHNLQDGTFEDVSHEAGVQGPWYSMGITVGDYNNDGYPDIYVSNYGPNTLYTNNGDGTFDNNTRSGKVGGGEKCSVGAVWLFEF